MLIKEIYYHKSGFIRFTFILTNEKMVFIDFFIEDKKELDSIYISLFLSYFGPFEKDELFLKYNKKINLYEFIFSKYYEKLTSNKNKIFIDENVNDIYKTILKELKKYEESD